MFLSLLFVCSGYQNIPVNLDEAQRQIGIHTHKITEYSVQHHERAQRVTHSLEALDEGSGTEMRSRRPPQPLLSGRRERLPSFLYIGSLEPHSSARSVLSSD